MANPVALLRQVAHGELRYEAIMVWCPGCEAADGRTGLHMLPVRGETGGKPRWEFDGDLEAPTLNPSILTRGSPGDPFVCHSFLRAGVWEFLTDSTHPLAGQRVPAVPLPDWVVAE